MISHEVTGLELVTLGGGVNDPEGMKPAGLSALGGIGEEIAERVVVAMKSTPQALKPDRLFSDLAARVNSCPSLFTTKAGFFRNSLKLCPTQTDLRRGYALRVQCART